MHPATLTAEQLLSECEIARTRGSGPGGQHRNKVETAIVLRHRPSGVRAEASERRSQAENQRRALFRLRVNLALEVREAKTTDDLPHDLWQTRVRGGRIVVSAAHDDFPALLADVLDWLVFFNWDAAAVAGRLGCSTSQLAKFLKLEPRAWAALNNARRQAGLRLLK